jgi:hypothetical protein
MPKNADLSDAGDRQIIGISLPRDLAVAVKMEAVRRNVYLKDLFLEMWALYKRAPKKSASAEGTNASQSR